MDYSHVCDLCYQFITWDAPDDEKWGSGTFLHYPTGTALNVSAKNKCHLCILLQRALEKSRRPDGEVELPDRQVLLKYLLPTVDDEAFQIQVSIRPESLATAGKHDPTEHTDRSSFQARGAKCREDVLRVVSQEKESTGEDILWILWLDEVAVYYIGTEIVSEDLYYATATPYHKSHLELSAVNSTVDRVLNEANRYVDVSTDSPSSQMMSRLWLNYCRLGHPYCQSYQSDDPLLPTRVIDVGDETSQARPYLFVPEVPTHAQYLTLSHCWGGKRSYITEQGNIKDRQRSLQMSLMPKTFRDAIQIARSLRVRYLWIDSLSIIQDSEDDWKSESVKMESYYRFCLATIAATDSIDPDSGCFRAREGMSYKPCKIWHRALENAFGGPKPIYAFSLVPEPHKSSLESRGWVLQEELLTPRLLSFGKNGISWRCLSASCEEYSPQTLNPRPLQSPLDVKNYIRMYKAGIASLDGTVVYSAWLKIVEDYSRRDLSFETDRLVAITGIATQFANATDDQYLAGMWQKNLWRQLMWSVLAPGCPLLGQSSAKCGSPGRRWSTFAAPSWSWASVRGHIRYFHLNPEEKDDEMTTLIEVMDSSSSPSKPSTISHRYSGNLKLKGHFKDATTRLWDESVQFPLRQWGSFNTTAAAKLAYQKNKERFSRIKDELASKLAKVVLSPTQVPEATSIGLDPPSAADRILFEMKRDQDEMFELDTLHAAAGIQERVRDRVGVKEKLIGHSLRDVETNVQLGFWVPDTNEEVRLLPGQPGVVRFLALAEIRQYVFAIGLVNSGDGATQYHRVGMGIWDEMAWHCSGGQPEEGIFEVI